MPEVPDTVDDALDPLISPSTDEVLEATRPFSAREIASAAASEAIGASGEGPPIAELDDGVNSIYIIGFLASAPAAGSLVLSVDDGENPPIEVTLPAAVVDDPGGLDAASYFAANGVTVTYAAHVGGEFDGYPSFEFTGDYGRRPITLATVHNSIVDVSAVSIVLDPADPVEVQAGVANTPGIPPDPALGDHYLDTRTGLTWTYSADGWTGGLTVDYVESSAEVVFTDAGETVIESSPLTFDGASPITIDFFAESISVDSDAGACRYSVSLNDGATQVFVLADGDFAAGGANGNVPIYARSPTFTPIAGAHTFSVKAFGFNGVGGTVHGSVTPIYLRINRA